MKRTTNDLKAFLESKGKLSSKVCDKHTVLKNGESIVKPINYVIENDKEVCPRCELEKNDQVLYDQANNYYKGIEKRTNYNMLLDKSVAQNRSIYASRLTEYNTECSETRKAKQVAEAIIEKIKNGEEIKVFLQGVQGAGKSHLAFAMLHELNEHFKGSKSCVYIETEEMISRILDSIRNKESKYTKQYFVDLIVEADFVVIDDLGAESGSMNTNQEASNHTQKVLYSISNSRVNRSTITTSNLGLERLFTLYDPKTVSRLLQGAELIKFENTTDKRIAHLFR